MKRWNDVWAIFIALLILFDRYTKIWALKALTMPLVINQFISLELALNRGISWGIFHDVGNVGFMAVTFVISAILVVIGVWTWRLFRQGKNIDGNLLILAGGISNVIDRMFFGGVVDFISLSIGEWLWPIFNVADVMIDIGILIVVIQNWRSK